MFIGHFGIAFAAKRAAPAVSLGTLFAAAQLADLVWPVLVLAGIETLAIDEQATVVTPLAFIHYPYSHSLIALVVWGALFGGIYGMVRRARLPVAMTLALVVVSHWLLDYIAHRPDMPLTLRGTHRFGLGLWNSNGRGMDRHGDVAARRVGLLGRSAPCAAEVTSVDWMRCRAAREGIIRAMWSASGPSEEAVLPGIVAPDSHVEFVFHLGETWRMQRAGHAEWLTRDQSLCQG